MAEKPDDQVTIEEKIAKAKELYARGTRNYYVKSYSDAADDLSEATKLYVDVYGVEGDDVGEVFLLYAKALISVGKDENKLIEMPENESEDEPAEEDDGDAEESSTQNGHEKNGEAEAVENGENGEQEQQEPEAGPSEGTSNEKPENEDSNDASEENDEAEDNGNLEIAWEVLQNAAAIFQRKEDMKNLLEVYIEMAGISMENGNFSLAIDDFTRALKVYDCLESSEQNNRIGAEIYYKIGLCQLMENMYDDSIKSLHKASDILSDVITSEKASEDKSEAQTAKINDLEETRQEILNKIAEIGDVKAEEIERVKVELSKLYGMNQSDDGACSSSSSSSKPVVEDKPAAKPTDISHLIKRKKPDTVENEEIATKKKIIESPSEEPIPIPSVEVKGDSKDNES